MPLLQAAPSVAGQDGWGPGTAGQEACVTPAPVYHYEVFHCYTPQNIRSAYGVDGVAPLTTAEDGYTTNYGQGQTIVLVDSYGSPTAASDLDYFHNTFFPSLPAPNFTEVYPEGNPQCKNTNGNGQSGCAAAAGWSGEATLDIEWAYSIAPLAHLILIGVPPAETEGVQGLPNMFKAISAQIQQDPPGTLFSMSFGVTEQTFEGAAATQTAKFDAVFQQGLAKDDNFFNATGDYGTYNAAKQKKDTTNYPYPTVGWPATSPYVVAVGGTQLQYGWTWDPSSDTAFTDSGDYNPAYWNSTTTGNTEAVWNEFLGADRRQRRRQRHLPQAQLAERRRHLARQRPADPGHLVERRGERRGAGLHLRLPRLQLPGAARRQHPPACWQVYGGTSAATPQTTALVALANAARAAQGNGPIGFLDPLLYGGIGAADYRDITPVHEGTAPATFQGSDVGVGTVDQVGGRPGGQPALGGERRRLPDDHRVGCHHRLGLARGAPVRGRAGQLLIAAPLGVASHAAPGPPGEPEGGDQSPSAARMARAAAAPAAAPSTSTMRASLPMAAWQERQRPRWSG